jgi:hypothetical protein
MPDPKRLGQRLGWWLQGSPWRYDTVEDFREALAAPWHYRFGVWLYRLCGGDDA